MGKKTLGLGGINNHAESSSFVAMMEVREIISQRHASFFNKDQQLPFLSAPSYMIAFIHLHSYTPTSFHPSSLYSWRTLIERQVVAQGFNRALYQQICSFACRCSTCASMLLNISYQWVHIHQRVPRFQPVLKGAAIEYRFCTSRLLSQPLLSNPISYTRSNHSPPRTSALL